MTNYFGQTRNKFHDQWYKHKRNMKLEEEQGTALLSKVHELKKEGKAYKIGAKIIREAQVYKVGDSNCDLCLTEKLCIALNHKAPVKLLTLPKGCELLNIRSEEEKANSEEQLTTVGTCEATSWRVPAGPQSRLFFSSDSKFKFWHLCK